MATATPLCFHEYLVGIKRVKNVKIWRFCKGVPGGAINSSGFLARTVEDLETIHQIVISRQSETVLSDPRFIPIPWNSEEK